MLKKVLLSLVIASAFGMFHYALAASFILEDIEIEGLERIQAGTVFTYLPVKVGDEFDEERSADIIRTLFKTGFFKDVALRRRGNVLIVNVSERPAIASLDIQGNKDIDSDALNEALKNVGIAKGRVFNRSVLERLENELLQQYLARGKYNVKIDTSVTDEPRNRVGISINIAEGEVAKIKRVNIVGNRSYEEKDLTKGFESGIPPWYAVWSSKDQYSKQKLSGDLEILRTEYLDMGYLKFNIESSQVSITPDKEDIYITINVDEGDKYVVKDIKLAGTFVVPEQELQELLQINPGDTFSRGKIVQTTDMISKRLGDEGYAFANINAIPEVDDETKEVSLTLFVDPGQRVYVERINVSGNQVTSDEVYRRELRQMEGGWYSQSNVELSRSRLQRLPYVESVEINTERVPGSSDLVNLDVRVTERLAGNFSIGLGFSQSQGPIISGSVSQENFLGSGKSVAFEVNTSKVNTVFRVNYTNPFYTIDGVSRSLGVSYISTDAREADISDFNSDQLNANLSYGIPLTEHDRINAGLAVSGVSIDTNTNTPDEINDFIDDEGDNYLNFSLVSSIEHDTRNRTVFANRGNLQRFNAELSVPGSDLTFYKLDYRNVVYVPLYEEFTLSVGGSFAYGDSYGGTSDLPFYEKYFAGGVRTLRGYENNSLGPRDSEDDPFGGNFRSIGNLELLVPSPFFKDAKNIQLSTFVDYGNVFAKASDFELNELRGAYGVGVQWISPVGALTISLAQAFNDQPGDDTQIFQFNLGSLF